MLVGVTGCYQGRTAQLLKPTMTLTQQIFRQSLGRNVLGTTAENSLDSCRPRQFGHHRDWQNRSVTLTRTSSPGSDTCASAKNRICRGNREFCPKTLEKKVSMSGSQTCPPAILTMSLAGLRHNRRHKKSWCKRVLSSREKNSPAPCGDLNTLMHTWELH